MKMDNLVVKKSINIKAGILNVWAALTEPELTKKYFFNCEAISEWKTGSSIIFREIKDGKTIEHVKGEISCIHYGLFVQYSAWSPDSGLPDIPENYSTVIYRLSSEENFTELTVTQENFGNDEKRYNDSDKGWDYVLNGLKNFLENQKIGSSADEINEPEEIAVDLDVEEI
jgi:uncharacterized protein YndB with AHSA1/START domain